MPTPTEVPSQMLQVALTIVGSGGLGILIKALFDRRQSLAAASKVDAEGDGLIVNTANEVVGLVRDQMAELVRQNTALQQRVEELQGQVNSLRGEVQKMQEIESENRTLRQFMFSVRSECADCPVVTRWFPDPLVVPPTV